MGTVHSERRGGYWEERGKCGSPVGNDWRILPGLCGRGNQRFGGGAKEISPLELTQMVIYSSQ